MNKNSVVRVFKRLFRSEVAPDLSATGTQGTSEAKKEDKRPASGLNTNSHKKGVVLRKILEFGDYIKTQVTRIDTVKKMLLFVHKEIFVRFEKLREIGLINENSYESFSSIPEKSKALLVEDFSLENTKLRDLADENTSLKEQLAIFEKQIINNEMSSGDELFLSEGKESFLTQAVELNRKCEIYHEKIIALKKHIDNLEKNEAKYRQLISKYTKSELLNSEVNTETDDLFELEEKIGYLQAKIEHQDNIINAIAGDSSSCGDLITAINGLEIEKKKFSERIAASEKETKDKILKLCENSDEFSKLKSIIEENQTLYKKLDELESQLQSASSLFMDKNPAVKIEELHQEAYSFKELGDINGKLSEVIDRKECGENTMPNLLDLLSQEKDKLASFMKLKDNKLKIIKEDPEKRRSIEMMSDLRRENTRHLATIKRLNTSLSVVNSKHTQLAIQVLKFRQIFVENKQLKIDLERSNVLLFGYKKKEDDLVALKKDHYAMKNKYCKLKNDYDNTMAINRKIVEQVKQLKTENSLLLSQYKKIFGNE